MRACAILLSIVSTSALAKYAQMQIRQVPIDRLVRNISSEAASHPENPRPHFALGRLHAMAYSLKTDTAPVPSKPGPGTLENQETEVWYGEDERRLPTEIKPAMGAKEKKAAEEHLKLSVASFEKALERNPKFHAASLGLGWVLAQAGRTEDAKKHLREALNGAFSVEKKMETAFGYHWSIAAEAADYLLPLLHPKNDAKEIAEIGGKRLVLERIPRAITPLLMPLTDETGLEALIDPLRWVHFDLDGSGRRDLWQWITPAAAWIGYSPKGTPIRSGIQLVGQVAFWIFWDNGFEALAALDNDGDGRVTGDELDGLVAWADGNANGVCEPGEMRPLASLGVTGLSTSFTRHPSGIPFHPHGVQLNSSTRPLYDWAPRRAGP